MSTLHTSPPIDAALRDKRLLGAALGDPSSWSTWMTVLRAGAGLPLDEPQRTTFGSIAGGRAPPQRRPREVWVAAGRGSGKSRMAAGCSVHAALLTSHRLAPGEVGHVLTLSSTVAQAKVVFGYCLGFIEASPTLRGQIVGTTASEIRLKNNVVIGVHSNSFRNIRGRTLLACVFDEISFWRDVESANPDLEVYRAVLPSLVRSAGQLIAISTPYAQRGLLYTKFRDHFGVASEDVLVVQGGSSVFNPTLNATDIAVAAATDPEAAASEWEGIFRPGLSGFLSDADLDACINFDRPLELSPRANFTYFAFVDPSGGRDDTFAIAIAHREDDHIVVDMVRGRAPPFDPKSVVEEFSGLMREYRCTSCHGDSYSGEWVVSSFKECGVKYERADLTKSQLYLEGLPLITRRAISLPNHSKLLRELRLLERQAHSGGRDTVDHARGGHDDLANVMFGVMRYAQQKKGRPLSGFYGYGGGPVVWYDRRTHEEIDPATGQPVARLRLTRAADGSLRLIGGDNSCAVNEKRSRRALGLY